jgi:hypothetical protein
VTSIFTGDTVAEFFKDPYELLPGNVSWKFHAASSGINSSLT